MADELLAPLNYSDGWLWLLLATMLAPVLFVLVRRLVALAVQFARRPTGLEQRRAECLTSLDRVAADFEGGTISARAASSETSRLVREFVSGENTPDPGSATPDRMTLEDMERAGLNTALLDFVRVCYDGSFAADAGGTVADALGSARGLVRSWN